MQTRLLTTSQPGEWDAYLKRLPGADVYHSAGYHAAHQANGDGTAMAFVAEDGDYLLFHPFMLRDIPGTGYRDIESVYGYSGPLATTIEPARLIPIWQRFGQLMHSHGVVAEFVRFNPLLRNARISVGHYDLTVDRETVAVGLFGDVAAGYSPTARNKLRKAEDRALTTDILAPGKSLLEFYSLYQDTMARNGAADYYSFSAAYFETLRHRLGDRVQLFTVRDHGRAVAASLFLLHGNRMHYHLTGSDAEYRDSGAGNLLIHEAALWGKAHGYRWLHLGGGRTNAPDDPLLRFKASMSRDRRTFYIGRRIHNEQAYQQLCDDWKQAHPEQDGGGYFLLWRKP